MATQLKVVEDADRQLALQRVRASLRALDMKVAETRQMEILEPMTEVNRSLDSLLRVLGG